MTGKQCNSRTIELNAEYARREYSFDVELQRVQSEAASKGFGRSGALVQGVADVCAKEIDEAADRVWEIVRPLLQETQGLHSDDAVKTLHRQIDELLIPYCFAGPERQFAEICRRVGLNQPAGVAASFHNRAISTRMRIHSEVDLLVRSLRQRQHAEVSAPLSTAAYWRGVLTQAINESEFKQPWKILSGLGTSLVLLMIQYLLGIRNLRLTGLFAMAGVAAYLMINVVALAVKLFSIPPRLMRPKGAPSVDHPN